MNCCAHARGMVQSWAAHRSHATRARSVVRSHRRDARAALRGAGGVSVGLRAGGEVVYQNDAFLKG
jgi:hypothetical protein